MGSSPMLKAIGVTLHPTSLNTAGEHESPEPLREERGLVV